MSRLDEYFSYFDRYQQQFGPKTAVLYQSGKFYEIYGLDNSTEKIGNVAEIADLLNIQLTRANKEILENSRKNPLMAGFNINSGDKFIQMLIEENYTVVLVDQIEKRQVGAKTEMVRDVTAIYSPSTYLNSRKVENYLVSIYLETIVQKRTQQTKYEIGLAALDLNTGKSHVSSATTLEDVYLFIQTFQPVEIVSNIVDKHGLLSETLATTLDCNENMIHDLSDKVSSKCSYQNTFLARFYPDCGHLTPLQYLGFEQEQAVGTSWTTMLYFCQERNPSLLSKLHPPKWNQVNDTLVLENNAINQLNLLRNAHGKGIYELLNFAQTNVGKRLLKERLLMPITNIGALRQRYQRVAYFLENQRYLNYIPLLKGMIDLEKFIRKLRLQQLHPTEFAQATQSFNSCFEILKLETATATATAVASTQLSALITEYQEIFNLEEMAKYNLADIETNFFQPHVNDELDKLDVETRQARENRELLTQRISSFSGPKHVSLKLTENEEHYLCTTKNRYNVIKANFKPFLLPGFLQPITLESFVIDTQTKSNVKLKAGPLLYISTKIASLTKELQTQVSKHYLEFLSSFDEKHGRFMEELAAIIAEIDVSVAIAKGAHDFNYCCPEIVEGGETGSPSALATTQLRHPLIERQNNRTEYISHSLALDGQGMLLYGVNASGKSSVMKAVGLAVIMAQAGFYVAAKSFKFTPYHTIMTRILSNDNIFKGLSSFAVEMQELRSITSKMDRNSLVLGDEVCHGTETSSAVALVAATIIHLTKARSSFIFATHLHQLSQMKEITELEHLSQWHLSVEYNRATEKLIYNRKLQPGPGESMYGLEVARAMKLPTPIIDLAVSIRKQYFEHELKQSSFNAQLYRDRCQIPGCENVATETHHIKFQSEADPVTGLIGSMPKDCSSNLIQLCSTHHQQIHHPEPGQDELVIIGYQPDGSVEHRFRKHLPSFKAV